MNNLYQLAADIVLVIHASIVIFIIGSVLVILTGGLLNWGFVSNRIFRLLHLVAIGVVVLQAWLGRLCPLTIFEMWLRRQGGEGIYQVSFIQYWVQQFLYYDFPLWVFAIGYTLFGILIVALWFLVPPRSRKLLS